MINWVGSFQFWAPETQIMYFPRGLWEISPFNMFKLNAISG